MARGPDDEQEHRIRAIDRRVTGFVIHCKCGWRSGSIDGDDLGDRWAQHEGS